MDDVKKAHDVWVVHFLEEGDFADCSGGDALVFSFEADLLEGNDAVVLCGEVAGLVNDSICAWVGC